MTLAQTYSWIFYAIGLASNDGPAKHGAIEQVADVINHAVPTQKEIRSSISWLASEGLVQKEGRGYALSESGKTLFESLSEQVGTTMGVWEKLEKHVAMKGVDNTNAVNPATLT